MNKKNNRNNWKKKLRLLLIGGLVLGIAGCNSSTTSNKENPTVIVEQPKHEVEEDFSQDKAEKKKDEIEDTLNSEHEKKNIEENENQVKNDENVPKDTEDNSLEQRQITGSVIDIPATITKELVDELKGIPFSNFNLDVNDPKQIKDINSLYVLANKANYFPENYVPQNLVIPDIPFPFAEKNEKKYLQKPAADAITLLINAAANDGIMISGVSGYRSIARQKVIYKYNVNTYGQAHADKYSAKPQYSEHHTGLCMDVSSASAGFDLLEKYGDTKEGKWLAKNAHKYGFVIRYPKGKEKITGYSYEPWHIRYLGVNLATYLYANNLCYEEFISAMQGVDLKNIIPQKTMADYNNNTNKNDEIKNINSQTKKSEENAVETNAEMKNENKNEENDSNENNESKKSDEVINDVNQTENQNNVENNDLNSEIQQNTSDGKNEDQSDSEGNSFF